MPDRQLPKNRNKIDRIRQIVLVLLVLLVLAQIGPFAGGLPIRAEEVTPMDRTGRIVLAPANIRSGPSTTYSKVATLPSNHPVRVLGVITGEHITNSYGDYGDQWYSISFEWEGATLNGYVVAAFVALDPVIVETPLTGRELLTIRAPPTFELTRNRP